MSENITSSGLFTRSEEIPDDRFHAILRQK